MAFMLIKTKCAMQQHVVKNELLLNILHYKMPCTGEGTQWCYIVKINGGEKEYFYDDIEGLNYQWGYHYTIAVEKIQVKKTMADASSFHYKLIRIINKEKASPNENFQLPLKMNGLTLISNKENGCYYFGEFKIESGDFSCAEIIKAENAIFTYSINKEKLQLIKLL